MRHPYFDVSTPTCIGHRGAAGELPENTLPSFERALARGAGILETDVHVTRDGVLVLIHDDVLERTTDGRGAVSEHSWDDLRQLDAAHHFSPDENEDFPFRGQGVRIPTLEEALTAFPESRFNLEIKEGVPGQVARTVALVRELGRADTVLLAAAEDTTMAELRAEVARAGVNAAIGASAGDVLAFVRAAIEGTAPPPGPMALQVPPDFGGRPLVTEAFVAHAHAHDLPVHVWTVNDPGEMRRLLALGVDGLISDFPGRVSDVIAEGRGGA